jgi:Fe2+ or Zn2+ uptake regulation protein
MSLNLTNDRQNTIVCVFEVNSPRISAYEIHEWIHENLRILPHDILMLQIDITKRHVYIRFHDRSRMQTILLATDGQLQYKHSNGEMSTVNIESVGIIKTRIRVANFPSEIPENVLMCALVKCGEVHEITNETWANKYRFPVLNGIRIAQIRLSSHTPPHIMIAGYRVLIAYRRATNDLLYMW